MNAALVRLSWASVTSVSTLSNVVISSELPLHWSCARSEALPNVCQPGHEGLLL